MLRITPISAGLAGVDYLLRAAGCAEHDHAKDSREAQSSGAEYLLAGREHGEAEGQWFGSGLEMIGVQAGSRVSADDMRSVYGLLENPETGAALGSRPRNYASTEERLAAALAAEPTASEERREQIRREVKRAPGSSKSYYDLTFSPVKSVSVYRAALEAAGEHEKAAAVVAAHNQAVRESLAYIEREVNTTRVGRHTTNKETGETVGEYARTEGLVVTLWEHSSSREGDPHIHTHAAVLNRTRTVDGRIMAVDAQQFKPLKGRADLLYERRVEELVGEATGARFGTRPDGRTREILGVDRELCEASSGRSVAIQAKIDQRVAAYRETHGVEPGQKVMHEIRRQAWATTRPPKSVLSPAALHERYVRKHGDEVLVEQVDNVARAAAAVERNGHPDGVQLSEDELIVAAVNRTQELHASWDETLLALELNKLLPEVGWGDQAGAQIDRLISRALDPAGPAGVVTLEARGRARVPEALRHGGDPEAQPVYRVANGARYATREHLGAEKTLMAEAQMTSGPVVTRERAATLRAELEAAGLGGDQAGAVVGVLSSGKAADILVGPAGTGKSFTVAKLDEVWRREFDAPVLGLATSQRATDVLKEEGLEALNTAEFLTRYRPREDGSQQVLPRGTCLVVDEAGMADTDKLAEISQLVRQAKGKLLYTGDDAQLSAVGQGGVMRLLAKDNTPFELEQVRRFQAHWEREASLQLRAGDIEGLAEYERHGRLRGGNIEEMADAAVRGYLADTVAGKESVLVVRDNAKAAALSERVRDELVALGRVGHEVLADLADDNLCGAGDRIQARLNQRNLDTSDGQMVVNREVLTVEGLDERGRLVARRADGATVALPEEYVRDHVTLAYASTVHAAQGRTTDTAHAVIERGESRNSAYVALTRGREGNFAYCVTDVEADAHDHENYRVQPSDVLREVLEHDGSQVAALEAWRARLEAADSLAEIGQLWSLVSREAMADRHHDVLLDRLGADRVDWISQEPGHERLQRTLQHAELAGWDVERLVGYVLADDARPLDECESMSDVLAYRVRRTMDEHGPRPVPGTWAGRATATPGAVGEYTRELAELMDQRADMMARAAVLAPPEWALVTLGPIPPEEDAAARRGWSERVAAIGSYREMYGVDADEMGIGPAPSREQDPVRHVAWTRAWEALGRPEETADHQLASIDQLRDRIRRWEREQDWAPVYVGAELEQTSTLAQEFRRDAHLSRARQMAELVAQAGPETPVVAEHRAQLERAEAHRDRYAADADRYGKQAQQARGRLAELAEGSDEWTQLRGEIELTEDQAARSASAAAALEGRAGELRGVLETELINAAGGESDDAHQLREDAERAERLAARYEAAQERYQRLADARDRWAEHTAEHADAAAIAAAELQRRGIDVTEPEHDEAEQLPLLEVTGEPGQERLALPDPLDTSRQLDDGYVLPDEPTENSDEHQADVEVEQLETVPDYYADVPPTEQLEPVTVDQAELADEDYQAPADEPDTEPEVEPTVDVESEAADEPEQDQDQDQEAGQPGEEQEVRGDYGTRYQLDEVAEAGPDYPEPEPVDPNQTQLFEVEAQPEDRVEAGQVRDDSDLSVRAAQLRGQLAEQTIAVRELRREREAAEEAHARAERDRADRGRDQRGPERGTEAQVTTPAGPSYAAGQGQNRDLGERELGL